LTLCITYDTVRSITTTKETYMTSEDYMSTREWDHEIEIIISDMREKLYDLKAQYITIYNDGTVVMKDIDE
jgi:hypothetical protein